MDQVISADKSETIKIRMKTMDWARELVDLFLNGNREAIQGLRTKYNREFNATILLDKLDHMQSLEPHWAFM
jgi:hypothetical protein